MTTWAAYDSPAPNAMSSAVSPDFASPSAIIRSSASGTDAAEVLPWSATSRAIRTEGGSFMERAIASMMRMLAWWGTKTSRSSRVTPATSSACWPILAIAKDAHRKTGLPCMVRCGITPLPGDSGLPHLTMQGNAVFRWASFAMAKIGAQALEKAGVSLDELDVFVPHQANMRIIDAMARSMKLPAHVRIARDIAEQGNSSAASVPLALDRMIADGDAKSGDTALLIAFGAGLSYAAQVITVP